MLTTQGPFLSLRTILLSILVLGGCSHPILGSSQSLQGIWMNDAYLRVLKRSFSPKAASAVTEFPVLTIDAATRTIAVVVNFHEGLQCEIAGADAASGHINLHSECVSGGIKSIRSEEGKLHLEYEASDGSIISTQYSRISSETHDVDGVVESFVAQVVLAGDYHDPDGKRYVFTARGASWNGRPFKYRIFLDYIEFDPLDVLCEIDEKGACGTFYGFATNRGVLQIYRYDVDSKEIGGLLHYLLSD